MHISVKGRHLDVGDALRAHAVQATEALVGKYFGGAIDAVVMFSREGHNFRADISAHPLAGVLLQGTGSAADPYAAFETAAERVERQLRRYKSRLGAHKGKGEVIPAQHTVLAAEGDDEVVQGDERQPVVIAEITADVPVCTVAGAVMRLDLADAPAIMFRNSAHGGLNVVYRRADGNIGWIDPQGASPTKG